MSGPLGQLRVLELSRVLAGPWAGQVLADFGAEVIKVEQPGAGDSTRSWGPPWVRDPDGAPLDAAYFHATNRGKRSVVLDLKHPRGLELARGLAARSDVVLENFRVGTAARLGLGWEDLSALNPGLIYCSISGFGQDGPRARDPAYDIMIQAMGGLMSVTGLPEGAPGAGPMKVGVAIADLMTGMYAVSAILAALHWRERTGQGQHIDLALLDTQVAWLANQSMNYLVGGTPPGRFGNANPNIVPYQAFATTDGHVLLAVGTDGQFRALCLEAGLEALSDDPRFATNPARVAHREALIELLTPAFAGRPAQAWLEALARVGVPCGPVNDLAAVFADPQVVHRGLRLDLPHPLAGTVPSVANPVRFGATPVEHGAAGPPLGWHTDEVLTELLGLGPEQLDGLRHGGVIGGARP